MHVNNAHPMHFYAHSYCNSFLFMTCVEHAVSAKITAHVDYWRFQHTLALRDLCGSKALGNAARKGC